MISFDYSFKQKTVKELQVGEFFMLSKDYESLFMKLGNKVYIKSLIGEDLYYNSYDFTKDDIAHVPDDKVVIVCDVDITVKPQV